MSFKVWFLGWIHSFHKLLSIAGTRRKSDRQREKERKRRRKATYESTGLFREKRKWRHTGNNTKNAREASAALEFALYTLAILLLPFGLIDWGYKSARIYRSGKKAAKKTAAKSTSAKKSEASTNSTDKKQAEAKRAANATAENRREPQASSMPTSARTPFSAPSETANITADAEDIKQTPDESLPISTPKHEKDQYIKKRMMIACPSSKELRVGAYLDMSLATNDTYGKNAIKLTFDGKHIGYVDTNDAPPFVTCLKLGRRVYGVITNVSTENRETEYQYEAWFDSQ